MTKSEARFRTFLNRKHKGAYIKKVPDYKQTGFKGNSGLPDYLVIDNGNTIWYEVKTTVSLKRFSLRDINQNQWREFSKMLVNGANIYVAVYNRKTKLYLMKFKDLYYVKKYSDDKSVKLVIPTT